MRLRFGGTISGSTITGGTLVDSPAISMVNHNNIWGLPGRRGFNSELLGQPGSRHRRKLPRPRLMTLSVSVWDRDDQGTITAPNGKCEELEDNMDTLLGLLGGGRGGQFMIQDDRQDSTTRWIMAEAGEAFFVEGPLFGELHAAYTLLCPVTCAYPFWQSETLNSDTLSGADTLTNAGNAPIYNSVLTYSGDGTLTNSDDGDTLEVDGSSGSVIVDIGERTVTQGGSAADGLLIPSDPTWMVFGAGTTNVNATVSIGASYRDHWW